MTQCEKAVAKIIAAAWADSQFMNDLIKAGDDHVKMAAVLKPKGLEMPVIPNAPKAKIQFATNTAESRTIVIPQKPEFTDQDMGLIVRLRQEAAYCCGCGGGLPHQAVLESIAKILGQ